MKKTKKHHVGWPLTVFILAIIVAILGITNKENSIMFLLLSIFLINAASFIKRI